MLTVETVPAMEAMPTIVTVATMETVQIIVTVPTMHKQCCMQKQDRTNIFNEVVYVNFFLNIIQSIRHKYSYFEGDFYMVM